ncbi:MAG: hypothetical protein OHK0031_13420 [Anaerolineales bacterium]
MKAAFHDFLIPEAARSDEKRGDYEMLRAITLMSFIGALAAGLANFIVVRSPQLLMGAGLIMLSALLAGYFLQAGRDGFARLLAPAGLLIALTFIAWNGNGLHDISAPAILLVMIISGLTDGIRGTIIYGALISAAITITGVGEFNGWLVTKEGIVSDASDIIVFIVIVMISGGLLRLLILRLNQNLRQARESAAAQAKANEELRVLQASLEERIEERTRELAEQAQELLRRGAELEKTSAREQRRLTQLQAISDVSQKIASIRDIGELLQTVTQIVSTQFGFYHVGIFLKDSSGEYAVLSASNSKGGKKMLRRNHKLRLGEGIVGTALKSGNPRIALNTGEDAAYFHNPDLPDTRSELALPLKTGSGLIGILDVQSSEANAFGEEDLQTLGALANQVAIAIENARLFSDSNRALNEAQTVYRQYLQREWARSAAESSFAGFRSSPLGPQALGAALDLPEIRQVVTQGSPFSAEKGESNAVLAVPLKVRDQVIGVLNIRAADEVSEISQDEMDLVQAVAERVGLSLENARLFEETSRRAEREKTVSEITSKIRSTNDPAEMLQIALDEIKRTLKVKEVRIVKETPPTGGQQEKP